MGQDLARLGNECDCWVSGEETHQGVQVQPARVDPVANLVSKDVPKSTLVPKKADESPPAGGTGGTIVSASMLDAPGQLRPPHLKLS
eukprot:s2_g14.t1